MSGKNTQIGGFVARQADTGHLSGQNLKQTIDNFALDYDGSKFTEALENGKSRYLLFEGKLTEPRQSEIPRGEKFGGNYNTEPPCTLNGFIACRSDEILPEFFLKEAEDIKQYPTHGSTIWVIEDGVKQKAAIFDSKAKKFIPYTEK